MPVPWLGQLAGGNNDRYIYPEVFEHFYDPTAFPRETCVLYKIRWNRSKRTWMNWCENQSNEHAEIYFLQHLCGEIERRREWDACTVTWYLSWTPCGGCSKRIIAFLHQNPHVVALKIRAARLYRGNRERNRHGLRALSSHPRIRLSIMSPGDYQDCWEKFVYHNEDEHFYEPPQPWLFRNQLRRHSRNLASILQGSF